MFRFAWIPFLCVFVVGLSVSNTARAHNLFVILETSKGPDVVNVIFEHSPVPGKGGYYQPLLTRGKTRIRKLQDAKENVLAIKEVRKNKRTHLQTTTESSSPRLISHSCTWGIYKGRLDHFHGHFIDATSAEEVDSLAKLSTFPLQIIPTVTKNGLKLKVAYEGKSLANTKVWMWTPKRKTMVRKTNAAGIIELSAPETGLWSFAATHTLKNQTGKYNDQPYNGVMYGSTCSIRLPIGQ